MARETKEQREEREAAEAAKAAEAQQVNAVVVTRDVDPEGNLIINVSHLGDVKITEVQFILEKGVERFREAAFGQKPS